MIGITAIETERIERIRKRDGLIDAVIRSQHKHRAESHIVDLLSKCDNVYHNSQHRSPFEWLQFLQQINDKRGYNSENN